MIIIKILLIFIFYIIILLLGILLIIIISPIKGSINTSNNYLELKYQYLFGLLKFNYLKINKTKKINIKILFFNIKSNKKENSNKSNNNSKKKNKFIIPNKTVIIYILNTLKKIIIKISPNNAYGHFIIGLDDPYYTVIIQMISQIIFTPLNTLKNYNFTLETDFLELRFKYDIRLAIDFSIIQLVIPLISLILKKPIREYFKKIKRT